MIYSQGELLGASGKLSQEGGTREFTLSLSCWAMPAVPLQERGT